jgi:hypothetical protein
MIFWWGQMLEGAALQRTRLNELIPFTYKGEYQLILMTYIVASIRFLLTK